MKIITTKSYFKTLLSALLGHNPYRLELEQVKAELEKVSEQVGILRSLYDQCKENEEKFGKEKSSYQKLVEQLRERCNEKEEQIEQMAADYRRRTDGYEKRVRDYSQTIAELQERIKTLTSGQQ